MRVRRKSDVWNVKGAIKFVVKERRLLRGLAIYLATEVKVLRVPSHILVEQVPPRFGYAFRPYFPVIPSYRTFRLCLSTAPFRHFFRLYLFDGTSPSFL